MSVHAAALALIPRFSPRHWAQAALPGLGLAAALAGLAALLAQGSAMQQMGLSALTLAIALGMLAGHSVLPVLPPRASQSLDRGVDFARSTLLRAGIVLYGFRISFHDIAGVGWPGVWINVVMVAMILGAAILIGTRWLSLDRQSALLIGAGSAICGAAAVMATQPVVRGDEHKVSMAIATVMVFGTLSMLLYPLAYPYLGLSAHSFGLFAGSTIHEVAQVVAVGDSIGPAAAQAAVVEKMLRVMLLAPVLLVLSLHGGSAPQTRSSWRQVQVPWFAFLFVAVSGLHSAQLLPAAWVAALVQLDTLLLATAMAAMGLRTRASSLRRAGVRPLQLAGWLYLLLTVGGYAVNVGITALF
ncbi:YeiH family protein [Variovorax sp. HJSM1_2]|uniref:YeiH family protein n=1 Tax=Variovorax sp. HJSM1_2 TaxID=3366263 RepID=UPI003BCD20C2